MIPNKLLKHIKDFFNIKHSNSNIYKLPSCGNPSPYKPYCGQLDIDTQPSVYREL